MSNGATLTYVQGQTSVAFRKVYLKFEFSTNELLKQKRNKEKKKKKKKMLAGIKLLASAFLYSRASAQETKETGELQEEMGGFFGGGGYGGYGGAGYGGGGYGYGGGNMWGGGYGGGGYGGNMYGGNMYGGGFNGGGYGGNNGYMMNGGYGNGNNGNGNNGNGNKKNNNNNNNKNNNNNNYNSNSKNSNGNAYGQQGSNDNAYAYGASSTAYSSTTSAYGMKTTSAPAYTTKGSNTYVYMDTTAKTVDSLTINDGGALQLGTKPVDQMVGGGSIVMLMTAGEAIQMGNTISIDTMGRAILTRPPGGMTNTILAAQEQMDPVIVGVAAASAMTGQVFKVIIGGTAMVKLEATVSVTIGQLLVASATENGTVKVFTTASMPSPLCVALQAGMNGALVKCMFILNNKVM
eukprot:g56201.t1